MAAWHPLRYILNIGYTGHERIHVKTQYHILGLVRSPGHLAGTNTSRHVKASPVERLPPLASASKIRSYSTCFSITTLSNFFSCFVIFPLFFPTFPSLFLLPKNQMKTKNGCSTPGWGFPPAYTRQGTRTKLIQEASETPGHPS